MNALFLSASVPEPGRDGFETADPFLIREAVSALVEVALGRIPIIWGGHPAITPMMWEAALRYDIAYEQTTKLYQSAYFRGQYPEENIKFPNWVEVPAVDGDLTLSLLELRRRMLTDENITHAVFIGGMEGITSEYEMLKELRPLAKTIALPSPGGVSRELFKRQVAASTQELEFAIDYTYWMYKLLDVDPASPRRRFLFDGDAADG